MASPNHEIYENKEYRYEHDPREWVYVEADSSPRPPVHNADNYSHEELGGYRDGLDQVTQPAVYPTQGYQYENNRAAFYQPPQSYPSSTASGLGPEGLERERPNLRVSNDYLLLGPDIGLNEVQHRRSASFHSDPPYSVRRYLVEKQEHQPLRTVSPPTESRFLKQDTHIQSQASKKNRKDRKRSKPSYQSFTSSSSEDYGFVVGADTTAYVGDWVHDERFEYSRDEYALTLSGMTDELSGE